MAVEKNELRAFIVQICVNIVLLSDGSDLSVVKQPHCDRGPPDI